MPDQRIAEGMLAEVPLFAGLSPRELAPLARRCTLAAYARGAVLAAAGAPAPGLLLLVSGAVRLSLHDGAREERVLRLVAPRETFCLASAVLDKPSPYQATALVASEAVVVPSSAVRALLEHDAPFARRLIEALATRELELCREIYAATFQSGSQRLASYIAELAGADGAATVQLPCSKTLIAARLGMKKETLSRLLKRFAATGIIGVSRGEIAILDAARLSAARQDGGRAPGSALGAARRKADQPARAPRP
jgi:CRP/FNR family transcriptional regulator, dissimilatory nitrate respiration regulator